VLSWLLAPLMLWRPIATAAVLTVLAAAPPVARTTYRVIQEGLTNARKHAAGQRVRVDLRGGPGAGLDIDVRNALAPHRTTPPGWSGGAGLVGLTERVQLAGGNSTTRRSTVSSGSSPTHETGPLARVERRRSCAV
jgi:glucose-6-phosphate-specific signal transduction histidine kinase